MGGGGNVPGRWFDPAEGSGMACKGELWEAVSWLSGWALSGEVVGGKLGGCWSAVVGLR